MRLFWGYVSIFVLAFGLTAFAQRGVGEPLGEVFFDRGEFTLREDAKPVLAEDAEILRMNSEADVEIVGYCNVYEGASGYDLGLKRAEFVRSFLVEYGVNLKSIGADCGGDEGNPSPGPAEVKAALDSRVSIRVNPRSEPGVL